MKVKYKATGEIADLSDEAAKSLIAAGIAEKVKEAKLASPTAVAPMTTDDMPAEATPRRRPKK